MYQQTDHGVAAKRFVPSGPNLAHTQPSSPCPPLPRPEVPVMDELTFWSQIFTGAMESLKTQHPVEPKDRFESGFSIRQLESWGEINAKINQAQYRFNDTTGVLGVIKKATRKVADNAFYAQGAVAFVPEFDYSSPVLALVKVLLKAAKTTSTLRHKLAQSLEDLEQSLGDVETYLNMFLGDVNIFKASVHLVAATFHGVENLIGYYIRSQVSRGASAAVSGDEYQRDLVLSLEQIKASSQQLIHQARNSHMHMDKQTHDVVHQEFAKQSATAYAYHRESVQSTEKIAAECTNFLVELLGQYNAKINSRIDMLGIQIQEQIRAASPVIIVHPPQRMAHERDDIMIRYPPLPGGVEKNDMEYVLSIQHRLPKTDCQRAGQLVAQLLFQMWMTHPSSAELLVHGDLQVQGQQLHVSGVTLFCANFVRTIAALPPAANLSAVFFFCGRHSSPSEPTAGGLGMLRCLVAQVFGILAQRRGPGIPIDFNSTLGPDQMMSGDIAQLGQLFLRLVSLLGGSGGGGGGGAAPFTTLFCVIDGIMYYERDEFRAETEQVLELLLCMARMDPLQMLGGCIFKLFITSPAPTRAVRSMFPPEHILTMSHNTIPATGQNFSNQVLARRFGDIGVSTRP
ncbi:hypothetical protein RB597_009043 [Gaeumannomyces tritici]